MSLFLGSAKIRCAFPDCFWQGPWEDYESHLKDCSAKKLKAITNARDERFEELSQSHEITKHMFEITLEEVRSKQGKIASLTQTINEQNLVDTIAIAVITDCDMDRMISGAMRGAIGN